MTGSPPTSEQHVREWLARCETRAASGWATLARRADQDAIAALLSRVDALEGALAPFAAYYEWRIAKGIRTNPPPLGPTELQAAFEALRAGSPRGEEGALPDPTAEPSRVGERVGSGHDGNADPAPSSPDGAPRDDLDKPTEDMSREDLLHVIAGYELITERVRTRAGEFYKAWDAMDDDERKRALRLVGFSAALNPWPASDAVIAHLREIAGLAEETCPSCGGDAGDNWFDRSICGCGAMHTRCNKCGYPLGGCALDTEPSGATPVVDGSGAPPGHCGSMRYHGSHGECPGTSLSDSWAARRRT